MFERFTERARLVVVIAQEEARTLNHTYIGTEHLLLGLLREERGVAARVLQSLGILVERVRAEVMRIVGSGEEHVSGQIPFTPRTKKVLDIARKEAGALGHQYIGTEHILLGVVREGNGVAVRILVEFDVGPAEVRERVMAALRSGEAPSAEGSSASKSTVYPHPRYEMTGDAGRALAFAWEEIRSRGGSHVDVDSLLRALLTVDECPEDRGLRDSLFQGAWPLLGTLVQEVEHQLSRRFDAGDLLVLLASVPQNPVARALSSFGLTPESVAQAIKEARNGGVRSELFRPGELAAQIDEVRRAKESAIEAQNFHRAAELRDQERLLSNQAHRIVDERLQNVLDETRLHLDLNPDQ